MVDSNKTTLKSNMNQVMVAIFSCIIILAGYFIFSIYQQHIQSTQEEILYQLSFATASAANEINEDEINYLMTSYSEKNDILTNDQDSIYNQVHLKLKKVEEIAKLLSPIYILIYDDENKAFVYVATSADKPYFRHLYKDYPQELLSQYQSGGTIIDYKTEHGEWISAFTPIKSHRGEAIGVVHGDFEYSAAIGKAREKLIGNILITFTVILGLSLILYRFVIILLRRTGKIQKMLIAKNREIISRNEEVRAQHEEIASQNESISESNKELERSKKIIEEKNLLLEDANRFLDQKVKERTSALEEAIDNLDNFLYRSYHDILGPVATLKGLCHLSMIEIKSPNALPYFEKINISVDNLKQSIQNINAVYELKNRHFTREEINVYDMLQQIVRKQQYLVGKEFADLSINLPENLKVNTDRFFLDLLLSDIVKNIASLTKGEEKSPISFSTKPTSNGHTTLFINDGGNRQIFTNAYFQYHQKDAINVNHNLFIFHNALKKLECKIINYQNGDKGQTMELMIPNSDH